MTHLSCEKAPIPKCRTFTLASRGVGRATVSAVSTELVAKRLAFLHWMRNRVSADGELALTALRPGERTVTIVHKCYGVQSAPVRLTGSRASKPHSAVGATWRPVESLSKTML